MRVRYYYRWRVFWLHLKRDARYGYTLSEFKKPELTLTLTLTLSLTRYGYTLSEFLPRVGWSGPFGTINCPFGHQAAEGPG